MLRVLVPLLPLLLALPSSRAWGPFSHVQFGGDALLPPPATQQQLSSFFAGTFLHFNIFYFKSIVSP
jgi:hypothetical protein